MAGLFLFTKLRHIKSSFTLNKKERLKSRKAIEAIFSEKKFLSHGPVKVFYHFEKNASSSLLAAFGVSNRIFKKAVQRNRVKRLMKEVYRLNKNEIQFFLSQHQLALNLFFIFTKPEMPDYALINDNIIHLFKKLKLKADEIINAHT